jgi:hypothetical protein
MIAQERMLAWQLKSIPQGLLELRPKKRRVSARIAVPEFQAASAFFSPVLSKISSVLWNRVRQNHRMIAADACVRLEFVEFRGSNGFFRPPAGASRIRRARPPVLEAQGPSSQAQSLPCSGLGPKHGSLVLPLL